MSRNQDLENPFLDTEAQAFLLSRVHQIGETDLPQALRPLR